MPRCLLKMTVFNTLIPFGHVMEQNLISYIYCFDALGKYYLQIKTRNDKLRVKVKCHYCSIVNSKSNVVV